MATKAEIRNDVLRELGVISASETATAADAAFVEARIDSFYEECVNNGLAAWTSDDYPTEIRDPFVKIVAALCIGAYGVPEPTASRVRAQADGADRRLRAAVALRDNSGVSVKATFF